LSVFVDTSELYALLVRTEEKHSNLVEAFRRALEEGRPPWTTSYVIVKTVALLQHRLGLEPVRDFVAHLIPVLSIEWVSEALHRKGMERVLREDRRQLSLVDCVSIEFMRSQGVQDVLALDPHFAEAGYRLLPPARKG
jgi:predicted nucleic acid-binding protein